LAAGKPVKTGGALHSENSKEKETSKRLLKRLKRDSKETSESFGIVPGGLDGQEQYFAS
jgi:hypothetical protein